MVTKAKIMLGVGLALLGLLVVNFVSFGKDQAALNLTADFVSTTGLYEGNEVQYLGVPVGRVTKIEPKGTAMRVHILLDAGTQIPQDAGAVIMQSSLATDRYIDLGPAYLGGPTLAEGAHIDKDHTRAPLDIDQVAKAVDRLVLALDKTSPGGKDIGDLIKVVATGVKGNGKAFRRAFGNSEVALRILNGHAPELKRMVAQLTVISKNLAKRDGKIRRFASSLAQTTDVVAGQTKSLSGTLRQLDSLTKVIIAFTKKNQDYMVKGTRETVAVATVMEKRINELAEIWNVMPAGAENFAKAYVPRRKALRIIIALREMLALSPGFRSIICKSIPIPFCNLLFNDAGNGILDTVFDFIGGIIPGVIPGLGRNSNSAKTADPKKSPAGGR